MNTSNSITDFSPFVRVIKIFNKSGQLILKEDYLATDETQNWKYGQIRGGTPLISPINLKTEWVYGFIHSHLSDHNGYDRYYFYTAVRFNHRTKEMQYYKMPLGEANDTIDEELLRLWHQSTNGRMKVVFPAGIMNYKDGVMVSFGVDDISSKLKYFKWDDIINLFEID